jgi:hypothetical protein
MRTAIDLAALVAVNSIVLGLILVAFAAAGTMDRRDVANSHSERAGRLEPITTPMTAVR